MVQVYGDVEKTK